MGYYTTYELSILGSHYETLSKIIENDRDTFYAVDECGEPVDSVKWYDHERDMMRVSKDYPDLVFKLEGEGEEARDIWIKYFKNGKMQYCPAMITFEGYDEDKLE